MCEVWRTEVGVLGRCSVNERGACRRRGDVQSRIRGKTNGSQNQRGSSVGSSTNKKLRTEGCTLKKERKKIMNNNNKENAGIDLQPVTYSPSAKKAIYYQLIHRALILLTATISSYAAMAQTAFVANMGMNDVSVIDVTLNTVIDTVPVGLRPAQVEVSPDGRRVYVSNYGSDTVSVIDV